MYIPVYNTAQPHRSHAHGSALHFHHFLLTGRANVPWPPPELQLEGLEYERKILRFTNYYYTEKVFTSIQKREKERGEREREGRGDEAAYLRTKTLDLIQ